MPASRPPSGREAREATQTGDEHGASEHREGVRVGRLGRCTAKEIGLELAFSLLLLEQGSGAPGDSGGPRTYSTTGSRHAG